MSADTSKSLDYNSLSSTSGNGGRDSLDLKTLKPVKSQPKSDDAPANLTNPAKKSESRISAARIFTERKPEPAEVAVSAIINPSKTAPSPENDLNYAELQKTEKAEKKAEKDFKLINSDSWLTQNGHSLTYLGVYVFTVIVLFRPYELIPGLGFLSSSAFLVAIATLFIYIPTQLTTEGNLTTLSTEVKAVMGLTFFALLSIPIAKSPGMAWESFNDIFIKAVLIFIVMVNVLRTRRRLTNLMWVSFGIGIYLSINALTLYSRNELHVEGSRVSAEVKGLFENPNEMSLHFVMMIPIVFAFGLASKKLVVKVIYFAAAGLMLAANFVTYSRGGFLGLVAAAALMVWKLGRKNRLKVTISSVFIGLTVILLAPGNYGVRILSIFGLAPDPVGSSDQRQELLIRSLIVTARNPWGIGMGNFPIVSIHNLVTHNAYTQVSSELGILALAVYLIFMISPFRKLSAIERTQFAEEKTDWFFYVSIGLQASFAAYFVSTFFAAVAYNWFIYYLIAYAVGFRRVYQLENKLKEEVKPEPLWNWKPV